MIAQQSCINRSYLLVSVLEAALRVAKGNIVDKEHLYSLSEDLSLCLERVRRSGGDFAEMATREQTPLKEVLNSFEQLLKQDSPIWRTKWFEIFMSERLGWVRRRLFLESYRRLASMCSD